MIILNIKDLKQFNEITNNNFTKQSFQKIFEDALSEELMSDLIQYIKVHFNYFVYEDLTKNNQTQYEQLIYKNIDKVINNFKCTDEFTSYYFNCTLKQLNMVIDTHDINEYITDDIWDTLMDTYVTCVDELLAEEPTQMDFDVSPGQYLFNLDNDDKIGQFYGEIKYDPHDLLVRDGPIVIFKDKKDNNRDKVLIGTFEQHHVDIMPNDIIERAKFNDKEYVSECYYYHPRCAYVDVANGAYTIDEVAQILKNDSRIKKVYLSPGSNGGPLKRLAKKI